MGALLESVGVVGFCLREGAAAPVETVILTKLSDVIPRREVLGGMTACGFFGKASPQIIDGAKLVRPLGPRTTGGVDCDSLCSFLRTSVTVVFARAFRPSFGR